MAAMEGVQGALDEGSMATMEGVQVEGTTRVHVKRPKIAGDGKQQEQEEEEEILVLQGVAVPANAKVKMDVFISHKDHSTCQACRTCSDCELAGSFLILPGRPLSQQSCDSPPLVKSNHRAGISQILRELDIHGEDSFSLAIVPSSQPPQTPISIQSITLEYE